MTGSNEEGAEEDVGGDTTGGLGAAPGDNESGEPRPARLVGVGTGNAPGSRRTQFRPRDPAAPRAAARPKPVTRPRPSQ